MPKKLRLIGASVALIAVMLPLTAAPALGWSSSASTYVSTNLRLNANNWMANGGPTFAFQASSVLSGSDTKRPTWIKVVYTASINGLFVSIGGTGGSSNGGTFTASWTNSNGARGAYLSGTCTIGGPLWLSVDSTTTASVFVYGVTRLAVAQVTKWT